MSTKYENMSSINSKINYDSFKQQYRYVDGSQYNGEWNKEGLRDGYGIFLTTNNGIYVGQFENGLSHGLGTLILSDNSRYDGEFSFGLYHGLGQFERCDNVKFMGSFINGQVNGHGRIQFHEEALPIDGKFEKNKLVQRENCNEIVEKVNTIGMRTKKQYDFLTSISTQK